MLIAFEGLDQSGKQTQAERVGDRLRDAGRRVRALSFPDYATPIGSEIRRALRGERTYAPDLMQLLYVANRYEWRDEILAARASGEVVVCDRYLASSIAYGEAQGLDSTWLLQIQQYLPRPDLTILLDIPPAASVRRKQIDRDRYERDVALLGRVRESYLRLAASGWITIDADRDREAVAADVWGAIMPLLQP
jgi:dTMP kinase